MSSLVSESGLQYRIGVHKNIQAVNSVDGEAPTSKEKGWFWWPSYDVRLKEPHSSDGYNPVAVDMKADEDNSRSNKKRNPFSAVFLSSLCCTFQHRKFRELYGDLTRIYSRLDICSASALAKRVINGLKSSSANSAKDPMSSPRINLIFQQQIYGPIVFKADSRVALDCVSIVPLPLEG
ncbi:hypothetical protein EV1_039923 [Malus domestica]